MKETIVLVGVAEAADMLGVFRSNFLRDWATRPDFPNPIARLRCGPVWRAEDVRAYAEARQQDSSARHDYDD